MSTSRPSAIQVPVRKAGLFVIPIVVWIASIGGAEVVFRLLGQQPTTELAGLYEQFGSGYKHRPWVTSDANWVSGSFSVITDREGLRVGAKDRDRPATSAEDLLVLGDSQAYGQGLSFEDTLVGQLATAARPAFTIRNAAVGGHYLENQFQLAHWLYEQGMRPKAVIIFMTPYLVANAGRENHAEVGEDGRLYSNRRSWTRGFTMWLKMHTVTYGVLRNAARAVVPDETPPAVVFFATKNESSERTRLGKSLTGFQQWANARNIPLFIVYTPLAVELEFGPVMQAAEAAHMRVDQDMPYRVARDVAAALHVSFYDLRPTLAERESAHQALSLYKDPHYNAATSRACAEQVWRAFQSQNVLRGVSRDRAKLQQGTG